MAITEKAVRMRKHGTSGDGVKIAQPDTGLGFNFESTYTTDSGRVQSGRAIVTPMFTVKSYSYSKQHPTTQAVAEILGFIVDGQKFDMYAFDPVTATWGWDTYYVGQGSMTIGYLTPDGGHYDSFSFNAIGVDPI